MNRDLRFTALKKTPFHSRTSLASRTNKYYNWNGFTVQLSWNILPLEMVPQLWISRLCANT